MDTDIKGLYSFRRIDNEKLKEWILNWDEDKLLPSLEDEYGKIDERLKSILTESLKIIKMVAKQFPINNVEPNYYYDTLYGFFTDVMFKTYFKSSSNSLKVGNYYEILIEVSDMKTKKIMLSENGSFTQSGIDIKIENKEIGYLGAISDLYFSVFRDEFIREDIVPPYTTTISNVRNNQEEFTLKLWDITCINNLDELQELVEKILYECSVALGLEFKIGRFNSLQKNHAFPPSNFELELSEKCYNKEPLMYFNFANDSTTSRHKFLAYYQVIEFYYLRAIRITKPSRPNEKDIIQEIIKAAVSVEEFKDWLREWNCYLEENTDFPMLKKIEMNKDDEDIIIDLTNRIYSVRCSIVHSKESNHINENFIPNLNDKIIYQELPLVKFVASKVLEVWSTIQIPN